MTSFFNAEMKNKVMDFVNSRQIDVEELDSYRDYGHPDQNFARFAEPDDVDWDPDEEFKEQGEEAIRDIRDYGLWEWTDLPDKFGEEAIEYIKKETGAEG